MDRKERTYPIRPVVFAHYDGGEALRLRATLLDDLPGAVPVLAAVP